MVICAGLIRGVVNVHGQSGLGHSVIGVGHLGGWMGVAITVTDHGIERRELDEVPATLSR